MVDFGKLMTPQYFWIVQKESHDGHTRSEVRRQLSCDEPGSRHEREWEDVLGVRSDYTDDPTWWLDHSAKHKLRA